jgi:hypothetical protein
MDKNKEYQHQLKQYFSQSSTDANFLQMQNYLLSQEEQPKMKYKAKSTTPVPKKVFSVQSKGNETLSPAPIFINHGDINININITDKS